MVDKGLIHIYTGDGKGKTTAAIGLGIRAVGSGYTVYMVQFLKGMPTGEQNSLKKLEPEFKLFRFEKPRGFIWQLDKEEIEQLRSEVRTAFDFVRDVLSKKECDVLILDEIMGVMQNGLIGVDEVLELLKDKPAKVEIVLTGRAVPAEIAHIADYISEIGCIKHPYEQGIGARKGIEF